MHDEAGDRVRTLFDGLRPCSTKELWDRGRLLGAQVIAELNRKPIKLTDEEHP